MRDHLEIRFGGVGGQGLQLAGRILAAAAMAEGRSVAQSQSYEPTSRGGLSRADVVIDVEPIDYPLISNINALVLLDDIALLPSQPLLESDAVIVAETSVEAARPGWHRFDFAGAARELGNPRVANLVALGALGGVMPLCSRIVLEDAVATEVPARFRQLNLDALAKGFTLALEVAPAA